MYICRKTQELVLSREAKTQLGMVTQDIDDAGNVSCLVCQIMTSPLSSGSGGQDELVIGGQLTLDLIVSYNKLYPGNHVIPGDLTPSNEPDNACRATLL